MDTKKRIIRLIETYLNEHRKSDVETMYGSGSKIKIHDLMFSTSQKSLMIETVIVLGETINEEVMDRKLADLLVQEALVYFYPELSVKNYVRWDV